jgi:DNA modification methylase
MQPTFIILFFRKPLDETPSNIVYLKELRQRKRLTKSIYGIDVNTIFCGDARDILQYLPDDSIDLILSSPPYDSTRYYEGHTFNYEVFKEIALQLSRVMKKGGVIVWVVADGFINNSESLSSMKQAFYFREGCGLNLHDTMIYLKNSPSFPAHRQSNRFSQSFEYIFVFSKGKPQTVNLLCDKRNKWANTTSFGTPTIRDVDGRLNKYYKPPTPRYSPRGNIWKYNTGKGYTSKDEMAFHHPAPFPDLLAYDCIRVFSNRGDVVLDPLYAIH